MIITTTVKKIIIFLILLSLASGFSLYAQGENLIMKIAVMGPGDELYFWLGHIALIIEDSVTGRSRFYDYGLFSFDNENFFVNFAFGRLLYSCGVSSTELNIASYVDTNRDIVFYTLDLPPETRIKVQEFAEINVLPENRDYYYHHFRDNCSTRIRDIIDLATDGQFKEQFGEAPGRFTLRQHVRRHTWFNPPADWALNFWMGQVIDTPITVWDEMFLPSEVGKRIEDFWYTDINGVRRQLVTSVDTIYKTEGRPIVLEVPRKQWPRQLIFSTVLSIVFCCFFYLQAKGKLFGKILTGSSMAFSGLVFGIASLMLYFLNIFTNHDYTYENYNMFFGTPLLLASVPLGIMYMSTKKHDKQVFYDLLIRIIWFVTALGVFVSMAIKLQPQFFQQNLTDQLLMLPVALVFAFRPVGLREVFNFITQRGRGVK